MNNALCSFVDDQYTIGLVTMLRSLGRSNPHVDLPYLVYSARPLADASRSLIQREYKNVQFRLIDSDRYSRCHFSDRRAWNMSPALRYDLFLDQDFDQILYLDTDLIVIRNIDELLAYKGLLGACPLPPGEGMELRAVGGFNAGVLSIGKAVRTPETWAKLLEVAEARLWSGNQTVLNIVLKNCYEPLAQKFNVSSTRMTQKKLDAACIVHYVGKCKPWQDEQPFGDYQLEMAGKEMCNTLLNLWREYAPPEFLAAQASQKAQDTRP